MNHIAIRRHDVRIEETDPMCLSSDASARLLEGIPWRRFAVLGDSIAEGIGDPSPGYATVPWATRVATSMQTAQPDVTYLNIAKMGATTAKVRERQLQTVLAFRPDLAHISCGGNDMFMPDLDLAVLERELDDLYAAVGRTGAQLSTFTLSDTFFGEQLQPLRARFMAFNDIIRRIAARHNAIIFDFWEHPARLRPGWLSADCMHPSMSGHAVVAAEMTRAFSQFHRMSRTEFRPEYPTRENTTGEYQYHRAASAA